MQELRNRNPLLLLQPMLSRVVLVLDYHRRLCSLHCFCFAFFGLGTIGTLSSNITTSIFLPLGFLVARFVLRSGIFSLVMDSEAWGEKEDGDPNPSFILLDRVSGAPKIGWRRRRCA